MYNRLFSMSYRPNFSYRSAANRTPQQPQQPQQPQPKSHDQSLHIQNTENSFSDFSHTNQTFLRCSAMGGIILPEHTDKNATYNVASLNIDTYSCRNFTIHFNFSCNIVTTSARMHLRFQLFKQGNDQTFLTPVSSSLVYSRSEDSRETNTFSFMAYDHDSMGCSCCNYSVYVEIMGFDTMGTIMITNPVLIASIIENNSGIV